MRSKLSACLLCCLVLGLLAVSVAVVPGEPATQQADEARQQPADEAKKADDAKKSQEKSSGKALVTLPGAIVPAHWVRVSPRVAGQVREVLIDEGTAVKAGQVLVRLDRTEYELEYRRTRALVERAQALLAVEESRGAERDEKIKEAEAAVQEAAAQREYRKADAARAQALVKDGTATIEVARAAQAQLLVAEAQLRQAESSAKALQKSPRKERVAAAKAALAAAEAQRDLAKFRLDNTEIRAPSSGTVLSKKVQVGETVSPHPLVDGGSMTLFEIADLSQLEALVHVPEANLQKVFQGQKCEIRPRAVPGVVYKGQVSRLAPLVSAQTKTAPVRVRVDVPEDDRNLRPGMHAEVRLLPKE